MSAEDALFPPPRGAGPVPIPALEDWQQQQQQQQQQQDRRRFEVYVRLAQGDPGRDPVVCAGCGKGLDLRNHGATTSRSGVTRCAPCKRALAL